METIGIIGVFGLIFKVILQLVLLFHRDNQFRINSFYELGKVRFITFLPFLLKVPQNLKALKILVNILYVASAIMIIAYIIYRSRQ
jgi:hypothetical protein